MARKLNLLEFGRFAVACLYVSDMNQIRCRDSSIHFGEGSLRKGIQEFIAHYRLERNHQGLGNRLIIADECATTQRGGVLRRERLGGVLNYYCRAAA